MLPEPKIISSSYFKCAACNTGENCYCYLVDTGESTVYLCHQHYLELLQNILAVNLSSRQ